MLEDSVCIDVGVLFVLQKEAADNSLLNQCSQSRKTLPKVEFSGSGAQSSMELA